MATNTHENLLISPIKPEYYQKIVEFSDTYIGSGYYTLESLPEIQKLSTDSKGQVYSYGLWLMLGGKMTLKGIRISFPHGWVNKVQSQNLKSRWQVAPENVGYFKSLFVDIDFQGTGWGPKLSARSEEDMRAAGAEAIVAHAWLESPENSSIRYLKKFGFNEVGTLPKFWSSIDYLCGGCQKQPCDCTAMEMIKYL